MSLQERAGHALRDRVVEPAPDPGGGEAPAGPRQEQRAARVAALLAPLVGTAVLAVVAHLVLERVRIGPEATSLAEWVSGPGLPQFALGTVAVWLLVVLVHALLGGFGTTAALVLVAAALVSHAHEQKLELRLEPLHPADLPVAARVDFLAEMVGGTQAVALLGAAAAALLLGALLDRRLPGSLGLRGSLTGPGARPGGRRRRLLRRATAALLAAAALAHVTDFHAPGNLLRGAYDGVGTRWVSWDQPANYARNGFVAGMLFNLPATAMERPAGYTESALSAIADEYAARAAVVNLARDPDALTGTNVVLVLSESLSDPLRMPGVHFAEDPLPFTRELMARSTSGTVLTSAYGGGTANVEFEVLTGMSVAELSPQLTAPFPMLVAGAEHFPSPVSSFARLGHRAVAVHPYSPVLYRRPDVYRALGFDETVFIDDLRHARWLDRNPFVSDESAYAEVLDRLAESPEPLLVDLVTMQNHMPYHDRSDDPVPVTGQVTADEAAVLGQYARGLRQSDDALRWLVEQLDAFPERTVVLVYGDHLPAVWPQPIREAAGLRTHETPFVVHANQGPVTVADRGTVGPAHLLNAVLDTVRAPLTPYQALLARVEQHVPARSRAHTLGPDGGALDPQDLPAEAREVLRQYRLVQYDLAVGERWSEARMLAPAAPAG